MKFNIISLFSDEVLQFMSVGVTGKALAHQKVELNCVNPRKFTTNIHQTVDDRPFGGGDGMVMLPEVLSKTIDDLDECGEIYYLSPQGKTWSDSSAKQWAQNPQVRTLICGRYAGVDQRFLTKYKVKEISLGDFVLSGGEIAAMAILDSVIRKIPGVLGNETSAEEDSFSMESGLLEAPLFTRPAEWEGMAVPGTLLSGHHRNIQEDRECISVIVTALKRPDLIKNTLKPILIESLKKALQWSEEDIKAWGLTKTQLEDLWRDYDN